MKKLFLLLITILLVPLVLANSITINSVESTKVEPGEISFITITLENQGDSDIKDVSVALDLSSDSLPFAPIDSAAEKILDEIEEDDKELVRFQLIALPEAKPQIYKIPLIIQYDDVIESTIISLQVTAEPRLEVGIEETTIFKTGDTGEIIVRFVNKGLIDIKFLSADLISSPDYEIISSPSFYIGNIEPDDFETVTFTLHLNNQISSLPLKVEYLDANNNEFTSTEFLAINIYSEEEAKRIGLVETNNTPLIITIILVVIVLFFIIRYIRKKRRANKLRI